MSLNLESKVEGGVSKDVNTRQDNSKWGIKPLLLAGLVAVGSLFSGACTPAERAAARYGASRRAGEVAGELAAGLAIYGATNFLFSKNSNYTKPTVYTGLEWVDRNGNNKVNRDEILGMGTIYFTSKKGFIAYEHGSYNGPLTVVIKNAKSGEVVRGFKLDAEPNTCHRINLHFLPNGEYEIDTYYQNFEPHKQNIVINRAI